MSISKKIRYIVLIVLMSCGLAGTGCGFTAIAAEVSAKLGVLLTEAEITRASISIFPDGRNLPEGQGKVKEGEILYRNRCAFCHGESGTQGPSNRLTGSIGLFSLGDPLRILRIQKVNGLLVMSTGAQWPYATSLFDFIRRAMPHNKPKSLTNNEVYALTAYILYLNDLVEKDEVIGRDNLPGIQMPALKRYVRAWKEPREPREPELTPLTSPTP